MAKVLSSISGNLISAASAGYAPTNSADVSAIASAYQVVSATATQLYLGTAHVTSINSAPLSASRAGNAANASMANSAYYDGTGRLISSLPDSATVSAIASGYATSKVDKSSISAQSAQWNSVYNTVNLNSASWSGSTGGGGDVTSPSGTIFVKDGNQVEGTNSAVVLDQTSVGKTSILPLQGNAIGPTGMGVLTYGNLDESGMNLVFMIAGTYHGNDATVIISGRDDNWNLASASGLIVEGDTFSNIPLGTLQSQLSASSDYWINLMYGEDLSGVKAPGYAVTGVGELAWKSAVDDVTDTVSANSASWGGGATGDYVETSAAEVAIGYSNVSKAYSFTQGSLNQVSSNSFAQGGSNRASSYSFAQGYYNSASATSFAQGYDNSALNCSFAQGHHLSSRNSATAFGQYNLHGNGSTATGHSAAFVIGDGTSYATQHDLMLVTKDGEITMFSSTADTTGTGILSAIRAISAAATGGIDSATVSAIASAYQVVSSTASGSGEIFGQTAYYATEINGLTMSAQEAALATYATNAGSAGAAPTNSSEVSAIASCYASSKADSSALSSYALSADVSSTINTVSTNSASWTTDLTDYATTAYVDSSVSAKADSSSLSSYALSADVSSTVDVVSTQSANWGGSALALSAGPGVTLTKSGNTLIAGLDETVLWSGETTSITGITLNESYAHFDRVRFYWNPWNDTMSWQVTDIPGIVSYINLSCGWANNSQRAFFVYEFSSTDKLNFSQVNGAFSNITGTAWTTSTACKVYKVVGINRTAGV